MHCYHFTSPTPALVSHSYRLPDKNEIPHTAMDNNLLSTKENPLVSIIIVNYNGRNVIGKCLEGVSNQTYTNCEILVVENGSRHTSIDIIEQSFPRVTVLPLNHNRGYGGGCNYGATYAKGDFFVFLNNDTCAEPEWLEHIVKPALKDPNVGLVGCKVTRLRVGRLDSAGAIIEYPTGQGYPRGYLSPRIDSFNMEEDVCSVAGAAFLIRANLFRELGGLDSSFFLYAEETDLCWRARMMGHRVVYAPNALIDHFGSHCLGRGSTKMIAFQTRNRIISCLRNLGKKGLLKLLVVETVNALMILIGVLLFKDYLEYGKAYFRGLLGVRSRFRRALEKRALLQRRRVVSDKGLDFKEVTIHEMLARYLKLSTSGQTTLFGSTGSDSPDMHSDHP